MGIMMILSEESSNSSARPDDRRGPRSVWSPALTMSRQASRNRSHVKWGLYDGSYESFECLELVMVDEV